MPKEMGYEIIEDELCPFCSKKTLTLMEAVRDIPYFGMCHIFSMDCTSCKYHKADVEAEEKQDKKKYTFEVKSEDDMKVRVIKSSNATVKIPHIGSIEPGDASNGYITNIEGVLSRIKNQIENLKEAADDPADRKKAKNLLKKLTKIMWGQEKAKIILEDPTGNSAIISPETKKG